MQLRLGSIPQRPKVAKDSIPIRVNKPAYLGDFNQYCRRRALSEVLLTADIRLKHTAARRLSCLERGKAESWELFQALHRTIINLASTRIRRPTLCIQVATRLQDNQQAEPVGSEAQRQSLDTRRQRKITMETFSRAMLAAGIRKAPYSTEMLATQNSFACFKVYVFGTPTYTVMTMQMH